MDNVLKWPHIFEIIGFPAEEEPDNPDTDGSDTPEEDTGADNQPGMDVPVEQSVISPATLSSLRAAIGVLKGRPSSEASAIFPVSAEIVKETPADNGRADAPRQRPPRLSGYEF